MTSGVRVGEVGRDAAVGGNGVGGGRDGGGGGRSGGTTQLNIFGFAGLGAK